MQRKFYKILYLRLFRGFLLKIVDFYIQHPLFEPKMRGVLYI
jgi:hypothetical protein